MLNVNISISLAQDESPSDREQAILNAVAAVAERQAHPAITVNIPEKPEEPVKDESKTEEKPAPKRRAAAKKAAPAPAEEPTPAPAPAADPEPQEDDQTDAEDDTPAVLEDAPAAATAASLEDAVLKAQQLVASGKAADVRKALTKVGAKRVSELQADSVEDFLAALEG